MKFGAIQHVSVPRPPGRQAHERAVEFYAGVLGYESVTTPRTLEFLDITWFRLGSQEVHVFATAEGEAARHSGAHFCITVDDIDAARTHLAAHGYAPEETTPIPHRPRFFIRDPFGNQIEVTTIEGDYNAS